MDIGKIYKIVGYGLTYYGSTTESLKRRLSRHRRHFNDYNDGKRNDKTTAFEIFVNGDDYKIELVEHILTNNPKDLTDRENYYITNNECVNKNIPNITIEQKKERQKKYNEKHKEQIKETAKKWAEKDRRERGIKKREEMTKTKEEGYVSIMRKKRLEKETPEEKEERLKKRRENYKKKGLTEEQKIKSRERARLQREKIKNDNTKLEELREYKKLKAREYRKNDNENNDDNNNDNH